MLTMRAAVGSSCKLLLCGICASGKYLRWRPFGRRRSLFAARPGFLYYVAMVVLRRYRGLFHLLALSAAVLLPTGVARAAAPRLHWLSVRASAEGVQNTTGNAFALSAGWSPHLQLGASALQLRLLAEVGALRNSVHRLFFAPAGQLLLGWQVVPRIELVAGAGVQIWVKSATALVLPVVTLEAHYVPEGRVAKVIRSFFVASSIGASSGAGMQVRAGLELDFHRAANEPPATFGRIWSRSSPSPTATTLAPPSAPASAACPPCSPALLAARPPEDYELPARLLFAFNEWTLRPGAHSYLKQLATALVANPDAWSRLQVVGHADARGTDGHNQLVSRRRADAVAAAMLSYGVTEDKLALEAFGESRPLLATPADSPLQRRVVLRLLGAAPSAQLAAVLQAPYADHVEVR